jgi:hypothetical protein
MLNNFGKAQYEFCSTKETFTKSYYSGHANNGKVFERWKMSNLKSF